jgi:predicted GNAT family acetyltransferase
MSAADKHVKQKSLRTCVRLDPWQFAADHRGRFNDHRDARESDTPAQLVEYFRASEELEDVVGHPADAEVVELPEGSRYELRLAERVIGLVAYRRRDGRIAFTHTEVDESLEGRGFGSRPCRCCVGRCGPPGPTRRSALPVHRALH